MPCDKQVSCVQDEYIETLNSIETLMQSENFTGVLLAGDWNTDFMRNNAQSRELECFLGRNDIYCSEHSGSYTYQTKNLSVRSNIDRILISHCLDPSMNVKTNLVDSGCNLSPHSPLHLVMPPPLGAGGIMFSGCPSVHPSVRSLKYPLLTCTWVRWSTRPTVTVLRHVRPSVCPPVRPSVRRGFRALAKERMEGMAWNCTCWCILTVFRTD